MKLKGKKSIIGPRRHYMASSKQQLAGTWQLIDTLIKFSFERVQLSQIFISKVEE